MNRAAQRVIVDFGEAQQVLRPIGELDIATAPQEFAVERIRCPTERVQIDFSAVKFIDAAGLGAVVKLCNFVRAMGGILELTALEPVVARVFTTAGLGGLLNAGY